MAVGFQGELEEPRDSGVVFHDENATHAAVLGSKGP
jgi:hypothetical protein